MKNLIGITGKARSGKDTFSAEFIAAGFQRAAFADTLKRVTAYVANEPAALYFDDIAKEHLSKSLDMTRRRALQSVGKALRDALGDLVWVNRALSPFDNDPCPTVVTDVRYSNEAEAIRSRGGIVIEISRPDNVGLVGEAAAHESELGVRTELIDYRIFNGGSVGDLKKAARELLVKLRNEGYPPITPYTGPSEHLGMDI